MEVSDEEDDRVEEIGRRCAARAAPAGSRHGTWSSGVGACLPMRGASTKTTLVA